MEERKIAFWDEKDVEYLRYTTEDEAVDAILGRIDANDTPEEIEIFGYARKVVDLSTSTPLEDLLESLEEDYGGEDGLDATVAMEMAEMAFLEVVQKELIPWQCEVITSKKVNIKEWLKAHPTGELER